MRVLRFWLVVSVAAGLAMGQRGGDALDINTATPAQLRALPGMGEVYARRVIEGRPYTAKNQLARRGVLPQEEYERIAPLVVAHRVAKAPPPVRLPVRPPL
jgi:competence protein ComEA